MKISIIVPIYNAELYLEDCIRCIEKQTYNNIETLFIEDCSTDNSLFILKSLLQTFPLSYKIIQNETNRGAGYCRNEGMRNAIGNYVFFMDVDDLITPDCIMRLVQEAKEHGFPDVVMGGVNTEGNYYRKDVFGGMLDNNDDIREAFFNNVWYEMPWNKLVRLDYVLENALFFEEGFFLEDTPWSFTIALTAKSMYMMPDETYIYRLSNTQKTASKEVDKVIDAPINNYSLMYDLARRDSHKKRALLWLTEICTGFLLSVIRRDNIPNDVKRRAYNILRKECRYEDAVQSMTTYHMPKGVKAMLIYRFLPYSIGFWYLYLFSKIVK